MKYEVQVDGLSYKVEANSYADAIAAVMLAHNPAVAVRICELVEGAEKLFMPLFVTIQESLSLDWCLQNDGSLCPDKVSVHEDCFIEPSERVLVFDDPVLSVEGAQDTPLGSVAINYDPITDEASVPYHVHDGHAYRLATARDRDRLVVFSDIGFEDIFIFQVGLLSCVTEDGLFEVEGLDGNCKEYKYAFVRDDAMLPLTDESL